MQPAPPTLSSWRVVGSTTTQIEVSLKYLVQVLLAQEPPLLLQRPEHVGSLSVLLHSMLFVAVLKSCTFIVEVAKVPLGFSVTEAVTLCPYI